MDKNPLIAMRNILIYNWRDEEIDFMQRPGASNEHTHIFSDMKVVDRWLKGLGF